MKTKLRKAIEASDTVAVKNIVIELLDNHADRRDTLVAISDVVAHYPEVFEEDDRTILTLERKDYSHLVKVNLREKLRENFSREKLGIFVDLCVVLARRPEPGPFASDTLASLDADSFTIPSVGSPTTE